MGDNELLQVQVVVFFWVVTL